MFTDSALMSPDFDEEGYLRFALHASNCQVEQARLAMCTKTVREGVHKILSENAEDMVQQVTAACRAQRDVTAVRQATSLLVHSSSRLRHTIQEPYRVIEASIRRLQNTTATLNTLRSVLKFVGLTTQLKNQLPTDLARSARTLRELEDLLHASNIRGIEVVDARIDIVERAAVTIRTKAQEMLRRGDGQDASGVAVSLQCFFTLGSLPRVLNSLMTEQKREVMKSLMRDLDMQAINTEINSVSGSGSNASDINTRTREVLFPRLQMAFTSIVQHTQVVVAVWRVLVKKVDPVTHTRYLSVVENPMSMLGDYWHLVTDKLRERLQAFQQHPNFIATMAADVLQYHSFLNAFLGNMREFLELLSRLEVDAITLRQAGKASSPTDTSFNGVEQLKNTWLLQVTQKVCERLATQIMDRHRERINNIISKLHFITSTTSNRPVPNAFVDLQRPQLPALAHALETRGYTMLATQDVMTYRQDPHTLSIVLECILWSLSAFIQPVTEATLKWPLPPLPSVCGEVTGLQMLHICVSNACTYLSNDLEAILASLPEDDNLGDVSKPFPEGGGFPAERWSPGMEGGPRQMQEREGGDESGGGRRRCVLGRRHQLCRASNELKSISKKTVRSFFLSASVLLLDTVSMCVDGPHGQEAAGVAQLQSQMQHFMSHYYYLFEAQTPALGDSARRLTDTLLTRLMIMVALLFPLTSAAQQHALSCLHQVAHVVLSLGPANSHGAMGRSTMLLKGQLHQFNVWYSMFDGATVKAVRECYVVLLTLPPIMARLLLLQRVLRSSASFKKPHTAMGVTPESFVEIVEAAVLEQLSVNDAPQRNIGDEDNVTANSNTNGNNISAARRLGEAMNAAETCFREVTSVSQGGGGGGGDDDNNNNSNKDSEWGLTVQWAKELWALLQDRQS